MKKKRFIKLLMAEGLDRNPAQEMARHCQRYRIPYFKGLGDYLTLLACWKYNTANGCMEPAVYPERNAWLEVLACE